ncbi:phosphatase PAP2 family protein [Lentzea sp. NBC_00516]|uniref:Phosphatase PAP2 family protein n=1 Tax=Lentzea sokolovensis TaxID=3095429 RepID=A0ABU4V5S2_9PSEU|nr:MULTISPECIES: phosphatase PAP2 family protein [unclassified Lentzea]MDX8146328.1 phosphatase PAP2 family protein [Lentzea sp. BCCO 10_0061]WUD20917.1 phosphatase PAP2 family protein [Lentzea sp. NBC_00516]
MTRVVAALLLISWILLGLPEMTGLDVWVHDELPRPEWLRDTAFGVGLVLGPTIGWAFAAVLFVLAWKRRDPRLWKALALHALCCATLLTRFLFDRVRPIEYHLPSYPSGHTVAIASTAFTLVVLLRRTTWNVALWAVLAVLVGGFARVVLEMHWVTDVIGAVLGVTGVGLVAALALGLVTSGRELVPHLVRPRRDP